MRYLLDTNVLSEMMKRPNGIVAKRIAEVGENSVCTSLLAIAEVRYGIEKVRSRRLANALQDILRCLKVEPCWICCLRLMHLL
jgi:tRNA(fMet)-specific endonuclease VapC